MLEDITILATTLIMGGVIHAIWCGFRQDRRNRAAARRMAEELRHPIGRTFHESS